MSEKEKTAPAATGTGWLKKIFIGSMLVLIRFGMTFAYCIALKKLRSIAASPMTETEQIKDFMGLREQMIENLDLVYFSSYFRKRIEDLGLAEKRT